MMKKSDGGAPMMMKCEACSAMMMKKSDGGSPMMMKSGGCPMMKSDTAVEVVVQHCGA